MCTSTNVMVNLKPQISISVSDLGCLFQSVTQAAPRKNPELSQPGLDL